MTNFNVICGSPVAGASLLNGDLIVLNNPDDPTTNKCCTLAGLAEKIKLVNSTPVSITASVALTHAANTGKVNVINAAAGLALTLPAATGSGDTYNLYVGTTITSNTVTITANSGDHMAGNAQITGATGAISGYGAAVASTTTITLNGTTKGGIAGDFIKLVDIAAGVWNVEVVNQGTGSIATPFS